MAIQLKDRILTLCTTVGTNDAIVGETKEGYQGWEGITIGNTVYYCITDNTSWEVGYGQYLSRAGTPTIQRNVLSSSNDNEKLVLTGNASIFCTYPSEKAVFLNEDDNIYLTASNITANNFVGKGNGITGIDADANNLVPEAPVDGQTYARDNKTWVSITDTAGIPDAPVDGLMYGRKDGEWDTVANSDDYYTKPQIDTQQNAQDTKIVINNDEIARQQIEITNNTSEISKNVTAINTNITNIATNTGNIASNTTAIGTVSGQVSQNSEDIAELQDSIFFSSAYSADYPSSPNRDPENGNMYLQNVALFTYSYADATQIFASKTDESGNVRQFTAIQPGDSIVLNEVDSPNYGRYELVTVEDVSDSYIVMNVIPKMGQGTVITGVKVAFQAFPKPDSGTGDAYTKAESDAIDDAQDVNISANTTAITTKIDEAPIDGKEYARKDANWTEVTGGGGGETQSAVTMSAGITATTSIPSSAWVPVVVNDPTYDTNDCLDTSTGKYTPNVEGYYLVNASAKISGTGLIRGLSAIAFNNTRVVQGSESYATGSVAEGMTSTATSIVYCNGTTDYIQMQVLANGSTGSNSLDVGLGTQLNVSLITGQSTGGSGGGTTDILPVLMSGRVNADGTNQAGFGFEASKAADGTYTVNFDTPLDEGYVVSVNSASGLVANVFGETFTQFKVIFYDINGAVAIETWQFSLISLETIAVGGSGGSYTPEKFVWNDVSAERGFGTVYTNTNDVPLYVQMYCYTTADESAENWKFEIDGVNFGFNGVSLPASVNETPMFIVPAGSTYKAVQNAGIPIISSWKEARMPVAIGTGGKTVAFRGELSADQTVTTKVWAKINLNTASVDTDSALADGKFQPSVAGYYQVNGSIAQSCTPASVQTIARLNKNGDSLALGNQVASSVSCTRSSVSDVVYLNGTTDYLEIYGYVDSSGTCAINDSVQATFLSAVLVSGGSASGDSIWTEEDGTATYDGNVAISGNVTAAKVTTSSVLKGNQLRVTTMDDTTSPPNIYWNKTNSAFYRSTATLYSTQEVDEKLAIKDKLIEKLSVRLDALEKKVK